MLNQVRKMNVEVDQQVPEAEHNIHGPAFYRSRVLILAPLVFN
jgi:hypothetical protein